MPDRNLLILAGSIVLLVLIALVASFLLPEAKLFSPTVALVRIEGDIVTANEGFFSQKTAFDVIAELEQAENDPAVSAIFIEVNSPGGSAVASKQLYEKIIGLSKPSVAWISDTGASGAYYAVAGADLIIADEDSITGSIGVISLLPDYSGLMEKLGVKFNVLKEGEYKDIGSPFREMTADENAIFQGILSQIYGNFRKNVLAARKGRLDLKAFNELADGRILTGLQAKKAGLIDETGSRNYALQRTSELLGYKGIPAVKSFENRNESLLDLIASAGFSFGAGFKTGLSFEKLRIET